MATTKVNVQVLDVGQGSGNLVEIYDGFTLTHLVLIDLGSELNYDAAGRASATYVVNKIKEITPHVLDALILTHSDKDHVNLLKVLLENFAPPGTPPPSKPILTINKIYFGGARGKYKKGKINYLTLAEKYLTPKGSKATDWAADVTGFDPASRQWVAFHSSASVQFYLIVANTTPALIDLVSESTAKLHKLPGSYNINMKSLVVDVFFNNVEWVITGDATGLTLAYCNQILASAGKLPGCFMVTMPHHASETTTFDLGGIDSDDFDRDGLAEQNLEDFVNYIDADTITASADQQRVFKHPSLRVMRFFWPNLDPHIWFRDNFLRTDTHFYNAYFMRKSDELEFDSGGMTAVEEWPTRSGWLTIQTEQNVFTTLYYNDKQQRGVLFPPSPATKVAEFKPTFGNPNPPEGAQWAFTLDGNTKSITARPNRAVLADALAAGFAPVIWPTFDAHFEREPCETPAIEAALEAARLPITFRTSLAEAPRTAASILRRLRIIR